MLLVRPVFVLVVVVVIVVIITIVISDGTIQP